MARRRDAVAYARRKPTKEPYDVVLIVCEGLKTEPYYFSRLRAVHRLSSTNIEVLSSPGTDPISIVAFAEARSIAGNYDRVFCVFDRDGHSNYQKAVNRVTQSAAGQAGRLTSITSWPCFELWLLLHFRYGSAAFVRSGRKSSCDQVISELKAHLPQYEKGHRTIYDNVLSRQLTAIQHAMRLVKENLQTGSQNPATTVHELVSYLRDLGERHGK